MAGTSSDYADPSKRWREAFTIDDAKQQNSKGRFTVAVLFSGGCIDTLAAIRTGFQPIWGTEICESQRRMWTDLTQSPSIGDTFQNFDNLQKSKINLMPTSDYLTSGAPCPDFSLSGSGSGKDGETGWMYVAQVELFLLKQSKVIRLEMSANALEINDGKEVQQVITKLQTIYNIHTKVLKVWRYGDPTNRERLFIVGTLKRLTTDPALNDIKFEFPPPTHDTTNAPSIRELAVPDGDVPTQYWRTDNPKRTAWKEPSPGELHVIARRAPGMGPSRLPNAVQSWDDIGNSHTRFNGGGRRPKLNWQMGQSNPVGDTRLAVPIESSRMASLSDSYIEWCSPFFDSRDPVNITTCINNGIPMRTCCAVDSAVHGFLSRISSRISEAEVCRGSVPNQEPVSLHISAKVTLMQLRNNGCATSNGGTAVAVLREFSQLSDTWKRAASNNQN